MTRRYPSKVIGLRYIMTSDRKPVNIIAYNQTYIILYIDMNKKNYTIAKV